MAVRDALASLAPRAAQGAPAAEHSGETSPVAVSYAMVEAARNAFRKRGWGYRDEDICAAITAALAAEPGEAVAWQWRYKYDDGKWGGWQNERRADADALLRENVLIAEESRPLY